MLAFAAVVAILAASSALSAELSGPWVEFGVDGALSVRAVVANGAPCPAVTADGAAVALKPRGAPDAAFPVQVCEAAIPVATARLGLGTTTLPTLPQRVRRIVVIGDTGCRLEGRAVQDCRDPVAWPFAAIATAAAKRKPDLVIHVGDYFYRESACPAGRAGCAGSPYGDNWPAWRADLFDPAAPLLAAAPWVMVRGNHELCRRGGQGWSRLLDPRVIADCVDTTAPYLLSAGGVNLLLVDSAAAEDFKAPPEKVATLAAQLRPLLAELPPHTWLLTHRPVWATAQADLAGVPMNQTEQAAIRGIVPDTLDLVIAGHIHDFLSYEFGAERPAQLVVGTSGDNLLRLGAAPIEGTEIDGIKVRRFFAAEHFGYFLMERDGDGWNGTLYAPDDAVLARCRLQGRELSCG